MIEKDKARMDWLESNYKTLSWNKGKDVDKTMKFYLGPII